MKIKLCTIDFWLSENEFHRSCDSLYGYKLYLFQFFTSKDHVWLNVSLDFFVIICEMY